jgi:hypothetical protein
MNATTQASMEGLASASQDQGARRTSAMEKNIEAFFGRTVAAACAEREAKFNAGNLMTELNQVRATLGGLGVVMQILVGNGVIEDQFDPADPSSEPPLSRTAVGELECMAASVCEMLVAQIERTASRYNDQVKS